MPEVDAFATQLAGGQYEKGGMGAREAALANVGDVMAQQMKNMRGQIAFMEEPDPVRRKEKTKEKEIRKAAREERRKKKEETRKKRLLAEIKEATDAQRANKTLDQAM